MKQFKKVIVALLIAALCLSTFAATAFAATKVTAKANLNIRSGPGTGFKKIGLIGKNKTGTYQDEKAKDSGGVTWYRIKYGSVNGWVCGKYVKMGGSGGSGGGSSSSSKVVTTGDLNIRSGPGLGYKIVGLILSGKTAKYEGNKKKDSRGVMWYYISYSGKTGWVSSKYSKLK